MVSIVKLYFFYVNKQRNAIQVEWILNTDVATMAKILLHIDTHRQYSFHRKQKEYIEKCPNPNPAETYVNFLLIFAICHSLQRQNNSQCSTVLKSKCIEHVWTWIAKQSKGIYQSTRCCVVSFEGNSRFDVRHLCARIQNSSHIFTHFTRRRKPKTITNLLIKIRSTLANALTRDKS